MIQYKYFQYIAQYIIILIIPIFLITLNARIVINSSSLYNYGFEKYSITDITRISHQDLMSVSESIRDYFNNSEEFLYVSTVVNNIKVYSLYNDREIQHMVDVKKLIQSSYLILNISTILLLLMLIFTIFKHRKKIVNTIHPISSLIKAGSILTISIILILTILSFFDFESVFYQFHILSFSNDLWQLDPSRDYLIAMFPMGFFFDTTIIIGAMTLIEAILLLIFSFLLPFFITKYRLS